MRLLKWALAAWVIGAAGVLAQAEPVQQGIVVSGQGRVSSPPDMASIGLGVTERAPSAAEAMAQVSAAMTGMLGRLDALGVAPADRQTSGLYLRPVYDNRPAEDGGQPAIIGYEAGNIVSITVRELDGLGELLDAVIAEGANDFNGLRFGLQDDAAAMAAARKAAVEDAMERATQLAEAAGVQLGAILQMSEGGVGPVPRGIEMSAARSMDMAIESGEVDVQAQVTMVFAIAPDL